MMRTKEEAIEQIIEQWQQQRWNGITRPYTAEDVYRLRGTVHIEHTLAQQGSRKLWHELHTKQYVSALGALTGNQAKEQVRAGLDAIYLSGWQVAADANTAGQMYPDQSLYPAQSVPLKVREINNTLQRCDQIDHLEGKHERDWFAPIIADAEAGFGGNLNAYEIMKWMIDAGAAGVHFEDQLASEKKCGHMGGKVLIPTDHFINKLIGARLAADVLGVPTIIIGRTDANGAKLITSDHDDRDKRFLTGHRTPEGYYGTRGGIDAAIARGVAYAPYCDLLWCETSKPDLEEARRFGEGIHRVYPGKLLAYNCSPSFNWKKNLDDETIAKFKDELGAMGYKFQFITLAGFHALNHSMFELAKEFTATGMSAYANFQAREFASEVAGYTATKHQREVGTGYFDAIAEVISQGKTSTTALKGSTEEEQFHPELSTRKTEYSGDEMSAYGDGDMTWQEYLEMYCPEE